MHGGKQEQHPHPRGSEGGPQPKLVGGHCRCTEEGSWGALTPHANPVGSGAQMGPKGGLACRPVLEGGVLRGGGGRGMGLGPKQSRNRKAYTKIVLQ